MRNSINENSVMDLGCRIKNCYDDFDSGSFCSEIIPNLSPLGLFERLELVTVSLKLHLPDSFKVASDILLNVACRDMGFMVIALSNYISSYGMDEFDISMDALYYFTKSFSSEFAIRPFIIKYSEQCFTRFREWVNDDDVEVRRLISEGMRPRLPWGIRLQSFVKDPEPILEFLEILKDDKELYVRRSVANNINDIAKDHPDLVIKTLSVWGNCWVVRHGLRTLIKKGNPGALKILGYSDNPMIKVENLVFGKDVKIGDFYSFSFSLVSESENTQKLVIDYVIYHKKANGLKTPKVFKLKNIELPGNKKITIKKKHSFKIISTRKYYSGEHSIEIKVNGKGFGGGYFDLSF